MQVYFCVLLFLGLCLSIPLLFYIPKGNINNIIMFQTALYYDETQPLMGGKAGNLASIVI